MSFIKKELDIVENEELNIIQKDSNEIDYMPRHPMLKWRASKPIKKSDHLQHYKQVWPFEKAEPSLRRPTLDILLNRNAKESEPDPEDPNVHIPPADQILQPKPEPGAKYDFKTGDRIFHKRPGDKNHPKGRSGTIISKTKSKYKIMWDNSGGTSYVTKKYIRPE